MPTLILLDVSLSMARPVPSSDTSETQTRFTLACASINTLLDYLSVHCKLEYVALVTFSSVYEVAVPFTRDYDTIKSKLPTLEEGDKTCIDTALLGINQVIISEWGNQTPVQVIIITDGSCGVGPLGRKRISETLPLPPTYPGMIHILPIASLHDPLLQLAMPLYQKIVDLASTPSCSSPGAIYCPDQLNLPGVIAAMNRLCDQQYQEFLCTLKCGQLEAKVQLFPPPQPVTYEGIPETHTISNQIQIIGFISQQDLGTPIAISKHLIIPQPQQGQNSSNREPFGSKTPTKEGNSNEGSASEEDMSDPSKVPNFCVLLHGALKVEGMAAVVCVGAEWWGAVVAWCEAARARRSCLLLSVMRRGAAAAPWLGALDQLGPADTTPDETFPVRAWRSYSAGGGAGWARPHALLADVQKVLRHARKLPEKTQHLYKELNRLRRAAVSLGFTELLAAVGGALERECAALPPTAAPECALQLAHAAAALCDPRAAADLAHPLAPAAAPPPHSAAR